MSPKILVFMIELEKLASSFRGKKGKGIFWHYTYTGYMTNRRLILKTLYNSRITENAERVGLIVRNTGGCFGNSMAVELYF